MEDYDVGRILGRGGFATVHAARERRSGKRLAIKLVDISARYFSATSPECDPKRTTAVRRNDLGSDDDDVNDKRALNHENDGQQQRRRQQNNEPKNNNLSPPLLSIEDMLSREISVHSSVSSPNHPHIVKLYGSFRVSNKIVAMVMEHCRLGDLQSYLKRIRDHKKRENDTSLHNNSTSPSKITPSFVSEDEAKHITRQILVGLRLLHSRGIVHRDIKASNILLAPASEAITTSSGNNNEPPGHSPSSSTYSSMATPSSMKSYGSSEIVGFSLLECRVKIGDFGLAVQMEEGDDWDAGQHTMCGTPSCLAPEVVLSKKTCDSSDGTKEKNVSSEVRSNGHGRPADLWSSGCIFYVLLVGKYPFSPNNKCRNKSLPETIAKVLRAEWSLPNHFVVSSGAMDLLKQLLTREPLKRGTAEEILSTHVFFNGDVFRNRSIIRPPRPPPPSMPKQINFETDQDLYQQEVSRKTADTQDPGVKNVRRGGCYGKDQEFQFSKKNTPLHEDTKCLPTSATTTGYCEENMHPNTDEPSKARKKLEGCSNDETRSQKHLPPPSNRGLGQFVKKGKEPIPSIDPIEDLHRLKPFKHKWNESKIYSSSTNKKRRIHVKCAFFLLPNGHGVVVHRKCANRPGIWLHVTGDGLRFYVGKLLDTEKKSRDECDSNKSLVEEAFYRAPAKLREANRHIFDKSEYTFPTPNAISICHSRSNKKKTLYKPLSSLLTSKHKSYISLYKKLHRIVATVKQSTPKVTIYLYSPNNNGTRTNETNIRQKGIDQMNSTEPLTGGLIAKVMLMENSPLPDVVTTFVDGITLRYFLSSGNAVLKLPDDKEGGPINIQLDVASDTNCKAHLSSYAKAQNLHNSELTNLGTGRNARHAKIFENHISLAQSAAEECLRTEKKFETSWSSEFSRYETHQNSVAKADVFPVVKKVIADGNCRDDWTTFSTSTRTDHLSKSEDEVHGVDESNKDLKTSKGVSTKELYDIDVSLKDCLLDDNDGGSVLSLGLL